MSEPGAGLADLIARLEAAQEGSRELNRAIAYIIGWWRTPEESIALMRTDLGREPSEAVKATFMEPREFPPYTTSLDAALTLVPEGWQYEVRCIPTDEGINYSAEVNWKPDGRAYGANTAIALCIACLKARAANG